MRLKKIFPLIIVFIFYFSLSVNANALKDLFEAAIRAQSEGNYNKSIQLFEKCIDIYPDFPQAYNYLALAKKSNGRNVKELIPLYQKAIEYKPDYVEAYDSLAKIYYELGRFDEAKQTALKAVEYDPHNVSVNLTLGWIYLLGQSEPDRAVYYFEQGTQDIKPPYACLGLGMAYFMNDQRLKVFEMITELRKAGEEDFALRLESMMRDKYFVLPENLGPIAQQHRNTEFTDEEFYSGLEESKFGDMKVRLRSDMNSSNIKQNHNLQPSPYISGEDHLRNLQQKSVEPSY